MSEQIKLNAELKILPLKEKLPDWTQSQEEVTATIYKTRHTLVITSDSFCRDIMVPNVHYLLKEFWKTFPDLTLSARSPGLYSRINEKTDFRETLGAYANWSILSSPYILRIACQPARGREVPVYLRSMLVQAEEAGIQLVPDLKKAWVHDAKSSYCALGLKAMGKYARDGVPEFATKPQTAYNQALKPLEVFPPSQVLSPSYKKDANNG